jgi:alginate O-acetyltransferase complex protein AlgI
VALWRTLSLHARLHSVQQPDNVTTASYQFVLFGLAAAILSNVSRSKAWRSAVLLAASLVFLALAAGSANELIPLIAFVLMGYAGLKLVERNWSGGASWSVVVVILVYVWLKKYTFVPAGMMLRVPYLTLGLSYIFFRVLHLLIDRAGGQERESSIGLRAYLLYTLNFTTLVEGPIQRYEHFAADQFADEPIALNPGETGMQIERIIRGFFKVNVLAMLLHSAQEDALLQISQPLPAPMRAYAAFRLVVVYPFFLYANFSGYIDIVIALARLMRLRLPENFDRPFSASSFLEFWTRWHITLSTWLKTYVYNPLLIALMRRIPSKKLEPWLAVISFFVTFFLVGIWHGRTSEFAVFGLLQGGGVAINKAWQLTLISVMGRKPYNILANRILYTTFGRGLTFTWFAFTVFWFWADWTQITTIFGALGTAQWLGVWLMVFLLSSVVLGGWEYVRHAVLLVETAGEPLVISRYARVIYASALGLIAAVITFMLNQPAPDVVYKAF